MKHCFTLTIRALVIGLFCYTTTNVSAQTPSLVYDINSGTDPSSPAYLAPFNGKLYFAADDGSTGQELWVYDGVNNPSRVADINSGATGSDPQALTVFNNALYFVADDGTNGRELWKYTGTGSPSMVANLNSGSNWAFLTFNPEMIVYNNALYFSATNGTSGMELYKYTGTGTPGLVYDIYSGSTGSAPFSFCEYKDTLFFSADNGTNGVELWRYTGTGNPTMVNDIVSGSTGSVPNYLTVFNGKLYFSADDGTNGTELWSYDNSSNPSMVANINTGTMAGSLPEHFTVYKNKLYFSADDGVYGTEPWVYSGTGNPTMVEDIYPGTFNASFPSDFVVYNDTLYFTAGDGTVGLEPRKYGGAGSVILVADIYSGSFGSFAMWYKEYNGSLYFLADDASHGGELWKMTGPCAPIQDTLTISACDLYVFNGNTYFTNNNTAKDTITGTGCDTIVTLNLTIKNSSFPVDSIINACDSFTLFGITYHDSAIVDTVLMNSVGCDSLVTFYIAINQPTNRDTFVYACGNFTWRGNTYNSSTNVVHTLPIPNSVGCDSTVTLRLTIGGTTYSFYNDTACYRYYWRGEFYENTGFYSDTIANSNGCDSVLILGLTINGTTYGDTVVSACGNFEWRGNTYYSSTNNITDTMVNSNGCDSVVTLNLTINKPTFGEITMIGCDSITVNDSVYKETGNYEQLLQSVKGCDSTLTIHYITQPTVDTAAISACGSYSLNNVTYTQSGFYTLEIPGCDTVVLDLTINTPDTTYIKDTACGNYIYEYLQDHGGFIGYYRETYDESGIYYVNIKRGTRQCDSVIKLDLLIHPSESGYRFVVACDSFTWRDSTYYESGLSAIYSYVDGNGCNADSGLAITINKSVVINRTIINCVPVIVEGVTIDSTGSYIINSETEDGCNKTVNVFYYFFEGDTTMTIDTCDSYELNGETYTSSGTYKQSFPGCPHDTITINLTIRKSTYTYDTIVACNSYTWEDSTYTTSTTDRRVFTNSIGCDSIRTLYLTIDNGSIDTVSAAACVSYNWRGGVYSQSGIYNDTLQNKNGCDSITVLELEVFDINKFAPSFTTKLDTSKYVFQTAISNDGNTLAAVYYDQSYKWPEDTGKVFVIKVDVYGWDGSEWKPKGNNPIEWNIKGGPSKVSIDLDGDGDVMALGIIPRYYHLYDSRSSIITFAFNGSKWNVNGQLIGNKDKGYGYDVSLSDDGQTLASGYPYDNGYGKNNKEKWSHAAVFRYSGGTWIQMGPNMRADGTGEGRGYSVSLSADGRRIIVGGSAGYEESDGWYFNESKSYNGGGVVYYWDANSSTWLIFGDRLILSSYDDDEYQTPYTVAMSADGNTVIVSLNDYYYYDYSGTRVYQWNTDSSRWEQKLTIKRDNNYSFYGSLDKAFINHDGSRLGVSYGGINNYTNYKGEKTGYNFSYMQLYEKDSNGNYQRVHSKYFGSNNIDGLHQSYEMASDTGRVVYVGSWFNNQYIVTHDFCVDIIESVQPIYNTTAQGVNFVVYPNPSTGVFTLRVDVPATMKDKPMEYEIYNIQGMVVGRGKLNGAEGTIALEGQPQGIYFVRFLIGNYTGTAKIMIQH